MNLHDSYQNILNQVMNEKLEGWDRLSPLDPTKMIVAGLVGSLAQIEERQKRLANQMLSLTPAYLGIDAKPATGPSALFQIATRAPLSEEFKIDFPFKVKGSAGTENRDVIFKESVTLLPLSLKTFRFASGQRGTELHCELELKGPTRRVELYWLPHKLKSLNAGEILNVRIKTKNTEWHLGELTVVDNTHGLSAHGSIVVEMPEERSGGFETGNLELSVQWENTVIVPPNSQLLVNAFVGRIVEIREWDVLGKLVGDAWEEVALPAELIEVPSELLLERAEGGRIAATRLSDDLLRNLSGQTALDEPFQGAFIYNSVRHSLIFPAAHLLVGNSTAGLQISAKEVVLQSTPADDLIIEPIQLKGEIVQLTALAVVESAVARERESEIVSRFHASLRGFQLLKGGAGEHRLDLNELHSAVFSCDEQIRFVELDYRREEKILTVFASTEPVLDKNGKLALAGALPAALREKIKRRLSQTLPLDTNFKVCPFRKELLHFGLRITHSPNTEISVAAVENTLTRLLAPAPAGAHAKIPSVSVARLLAELHSTLPHSFKVEGTVVAEATGAYVENLQRQPGTIFQAKCALDLQVVKYA